MILRGVQKAPSCPRGWGVQARGSFLILGTAGCSNISALLGLECFKISCYVVVAFCLSELDQDPSGTLALAFPGQFNNMKCTLQLDEKWRSESPLYFVKNGLIPADGAVAEAPAWRARPCWIHQSLIQFIKTSLDLI